MALFHLCPPPSPPAKPSSDFAYAVVWVEESETHSIRYSTTDIVGVGKIMSRGPFGACLH